MEFTPEKKKEIENLIVEKSITALEQGFIKEYGLGEIATFVLEKIDKVQSQQQLVEFLRELSNKWHFFSELLVIESGEIELAKEKSSIGEIEQLTKNGHLDEAIKLAKDSTEQQRVKGGGQ
ncbi:MAG: hypothetical protein ACHQT7_02175 [Candidatus Levyibacteriota bacterium]